ncbi:hypothetical protein [Naasia lichenicola]|uniref:Uncharacterized protein n=1 Tax=Naasia lichenicola TaxID=2565933 RepID=A0A4S4FER1_9MICO|nr:hypothetical protein [Naasia lichenicola]THG28591.1 hypothetical protein E6C64_17470 [Naasia lichenicola]
MLQTELVVAVLHLIAVLGMPVDGQLLLVGAGLMLAGVAVGLVLRRLGATAAPVRELASADRLHAPELAALVSETLWRAAGRPEPRAPSRHLSTARA